MQQKLFFQRRSATEIRHNGRQHDMRGFGGRRQGHLCGTYKRVHAVIRMPPLGELAAFGYYKHRCFRAIPGVRFKWKTFTIRIRTRNSVLRRSASFAATRIRPACTPECRSTFRGSKGSYGRNSLEFIIPIGRVGRRLIRKHPRNV